VGICNGCEGEALIERLTSGSRTHTKAETSIKQTLCFGTATLGTVGIELLASRPRCFTTGERAPGTHWIGGWVGPRAGLDDMEK
jgi:hypothetical protein